MGGATSADVGGADPAGAAGGVRRPRRAFGAGGADRPLRKERAWKFLIITGLSGGGKSRAASYLEDIGYYTVDNLPAEMMVKFADFCAGSSGRYDRVALVYDVRPGNPRTSLSRRWSA